MAIFLQNIFSSYNSWILIIFNNPKKKLQAGCVAIHIRNKIRNESKIESKNCEYPSSTIFMGTIMPNK